MRPIGGIASRIRHRRPPISTRSIGRLAYYETRSTNPNYEILTSFGAYAAARMNAEHGRNYNVHKYLDWVFSRSAARPDLVMISGEQWGGEDVGGLLGTTRPNTSNPVQGYAFAMNTYANAMPVVALARYEDRYSRAIGKWMLNAANAARLFYGNAHPPENQSSEFWTGDPQNSIAYEGLRHHWLPPQDLAPGENEEIYAAGDPLTYDWGPLTDFGIYGSAFTGVLGSIIKTTNVEKILQLDLLATDFYRDAAHSTLSVLQSASRPTQSVAIDLGSGSVVRSVRRRVEPLRQRGATGQTFFNVPSDEAVMLVLVPSGGTETTAGASTCSSMAWSSITTRRCCPTIWFAIQTSIRRIPTTPIDPPSGTTAPMPPGPMT